MRRALFVGFVLVSGSFVTQLSVVAAPGDSPGIPYSGYAEDSLGKPVSGSHEMLLRYFDGDSEIPHYVETHSETHCVDGQFELILGEGIANSENRGRHFSQMTASFEAMEIEIVVDGTVQTPRIVMIAIARGTGKNIRFLGANSGRPPDSLTERTTAGRGVALQAVTLRPKTKEIVGESDEGMRTNPFLVSTVFLGTSRSVRSLPPYDPADEPKRLLFELDPESPVEVARVEETVSSFNQSARIEDPLAHASRQRDGGASRAPDLLVDFDGLPSTIIGPPDPEGAVGPDHYVQGVNIAFRIFEKGGVPLTEPIATNSLYTDSGSGCESDLYADLIIAYDEVADRWVLTHLAVAPGVGIIACMAVSTTGDPTGEYFLYELVTVETPDYPKVGVWPDPVHNAYFISTIPGPEGTYDIYAVDRESLLAGTAPRPAQRFTRNPNFMMPADLDGPRPAPPGSPGIFYTFRDGGNDFFVPGTPVDTLDLYEFAVDWEIPALSSLTHVQSFTPPEFAEFNWTLCGQDDEGKCLSQPGTEQKIDSVSWLPMQRLQYRNLGRYETLVGVWTVNTVAEGQHAAPRWFELRRSNGSDWAIARQGTFAPDDSHRWMASVALDGSGNMAMGYNVVNADAGIYPSLRYTVRTVDNPHFVDEATQITGTGYVDGLPRWGDYSSMEVDPTDDCTFWFTGEYVKTSGPSTWNTRISAFKLPSCTGSLRNLPDGGPEETQHND